MNRTKFAGIVLGLVGVVLLAGSIFLALTYVGAIMNAMVGFVTTNSGAISNCGISIPKEIVDLKDEIATTILPGLYLGIPLAVIIISVIMFAGGYFYGRGSYQDQLSTEKRRKEAVEEEVERRVSKKKQKPVEEPEEEESQ
jgi:hypothetical protein